MACKFCGSEELRKNGFTRGKQRYFCKNCGRNHVDGDVRERHHKVVKYMAIVLYLEGCGFRRIARILRQIFGIKIHDPLIIHWVRKLGLMVENVCGVPKEKEKIPILEMDELYTYIKKNSIKSEYGLLLIETGCVLLDLKLATEAQKL
jgi:hypothetical protein